MDTDRKKSLKLDPNDDFNYFLKVLGNYIRSERKKAGFSTASSFAIFIGLAESQYREYERGETDIQMSSLLKIFKGLNKRIEDIFALNILGLELTNIETTTTGPSLIETQVRAQVAKLSGLSLEKDLNSEDIFRMFRILLFCFNAHRRKDILKHLKLADKTANFLKVFKLLLINNWLAMQYPDNPNTPSQKYYTTDEGKKVIQVV